MLARSACAVVTASVLAACGSPSPDMRALMQQQYASAESQMQSMRALQDKQHLMQELMKNPDLPEWHEQRQKIVMAQGDRVFDKSFNRIFDSMTVALATLECQVQNMERASGYITATLPALPPQQRDQLRAESLRTYAEAKGYSPRLLDPPRRKVEVAGRQPIPVVDVDDLFDLEGTLGMMERNIGGVTLSLVRQGEKQTKVKLRFDKVYYPSQVQEFYRMVWAAVDKQIFLDQALD